MYSLFRCSLWFCSLLILALLCAVPATVLAEPKAADLVKDGQLIDLKQAKYKIMFKELEQKHHFKPDELQRIFKEQKISQRVLELMDQPWEAKPYYQYFPLFLTPKNILTGRMKLKKHKELFDRIEKKYGVNREVITAIWGIETRYGSNQGDFNILQTLNTLFAAYPKRSKFFGEQLIHFLILCKENGIDPHTAKGSYAGAFGQAQFIPTSFQSYAVSFDGNDQSDLWNSVPDALASIANYLKHHGWILDTPVYAELGNKLKGKELIAAMKKGRKGRVPWQLVHDLQRADIPSAPKGTPLSIIDLQLTPKQSRYVAGYPNFHAITEYNHSNMYGMAVSELAESFTIK